MSLTPPAAAPTPAQAPPPPIEDAPVEVHNPPAQSCHNPPKPAAQQAPAQNKPTAPPPHPHSPIPNPQSHHPLAPRQFRAAVLLVRGHTLKTVARHLGVNRHTVADWLKRPDFQQELNRLLDQ